MTDAKAAQRRANDRRFLAVMVVLSGAFLVWAALASLDVVSTANGEVIPATRVKSVQHLEGGIVAEILVDEGMTVVHGQPLVRLEPLRAQAEVAEVAKRLRALRIEVARLTAEAGPFPTVDFPADLSAENPEQVTAAREIFETRRNRLAHEIATQQDLIDQRQNELRELGLRLTNSRKTLELVISQVGISANLLRGDLTSRMAHLELQRQEQTLRTTIDADQAAMPRIEAALREARDRLGAVRDTALEQARKDLATARQTLDELAQRYLKFRNIEERTVLRAPVDGIVKTLAVATEGGVIQAGQTVAEIVPIADQLVIEAQLPIQDIGFVRVGQTARITLKTPEAAAFGFIEGTVLTVSPDAISIAGKYSFYKVRIGTVKTRFESGHRTYQLYPGMQVLCSILIGHRTILDYLLSPWIRNLRFAFQER